MGIDAGWESQAVTGLDVAAMAASNRIASAHNVLERPLAGVPDDSSQAEKHFTAADVTELTANSTVSDMPGFQVAHSDSHTGSDSGRFHVAAGAEGSAFDMARENVGVTQIDQGFSANLAAHNYAEQTVGHIVDYTA